MHKYIHIYLHIYRTLYYIKKRKEKKRKGIHSGQIIMACQKKLFQLSFQWFLLLSFILLEGFTCEKCIQARKEINTKTSTHNFGVSEYNSEHNDIKFSKYSKYYDISNNEYISSISSSFGNGKSNLFYRLISFANQKSNQKVEPSSTDNFRDYRDRTYYGSDFQNTNANVNSNSNSINNNGNEKN